MRTTSNSRPAALFARWRVIPVAAALLALVWVLPALSSNPLSSHKQPARPMNVQIAPVVIYPLAPFQAAGGNSYALYVDNFTADSISGWRYTVELTNHSCTGATVTINTRQFVGTSDFGSGVSSLTRVIDVVPGQNTLKIGVKGSSSAYVEVRVLRSPEPAFTVFGRQVYLSTGATWTQTDTFRIPADATTPHTLWILNGDTSGTTHRVSNATVSVNGTQVMSANDFGTGRAAASKQVSLQDTNWVTVSNSSGSQTRVNLWLTSTGSRAPTETLGWPTATDTIATSSTVMIRDTVTDHLHGLISVVTASGSQIFETPDTLAAPIVFAADGRYPITIYARNSGGLDTTIQRVLYRDTTPPTLTDSTVTPSSGSTITVSGTWSDLTRTTVTVDGDTVGVGTSGKFTKVDTLDLGSNGITYCAIDAAGNKTQYKRFIYITPQEVHPPIAAGVVTDRAGTLAQTEIPSFRDQVSFLFSGTSPIQTLANPTAIATGREAVLRGYVVARDFGALPNDTVRVLNHPEFGYTLTRDDGGFDLVVTGGASYVLRFQKPGFLEAQRQVTAAPLDYTVLDTLAMIGRSQRWYYADTSYSQVVVGHLESDGNADRRLYMFVRNGTLATVAATAGAPQVLSKYRIKLKEFTVGSGGPSTMPGQLPATTAYTYCVDMSLAEADSINDQSVAGAWPADISFNKPIVTFVREFLGLPVGTIMPSGYYDLRKGVWVPDENGRVVKVVGITGGVASLDTDGDNQADSLAQYATAGIDTLERMKIAEVFKSGDVFWRNRVTHFSPHDFNLNMASNGNLGSANAVNGGPGIPLIGDPEKTCACIIENENRVLGETIPIKGTPFSLTYRSSRQPGDKASRWIRMPLTGTTVPTGLSRVQVVVDVAGKRYKRAYPVTGSNQTETFKDWDGIDAYGRPVPGSVTATVRIGYEFKQSYALRGPGNNQFNNRSSIPTGSGASISGDRDINTIDWTTQQVSVGAPSMSSAGLGGWNISPHHFYDTNGRGTLYLGDGAVRYGYRQNPVIRTYAGNGQTGSSLPDSMSLTARGITPGSLVFGPDGSLYFASTVGSGPYASKMIFRIKPNGHIIPWVGSATAGTDVDTNYPHDGEFAQTPDHRICTPDGLAVGPDGSLYIADSGWRQVFKVTPDDTLHVIAGSYPLGYGGFSEGAVAKSHALIAPNEVAVGPDGSIYIGDSGYQRVVRIGADGLMHSFAGDSCCVGGTSGKADSLSIGSFSGLTTDPQGNVYIATGSWLWMVTPDGHMTRISAGDHGLSKLAVGYDGTLYMCTGVAYPGVLRRERDGSLSTIAGLFASVVQGEYIYPNFAAEDGGFARAANLSGLGGVAMGPDGKLYISQNGPTADTQGCGIRTIATDQPGATTGELAYPSEDGREVNYFTLTGRHLRTADVTTGVTLYSFDYDGAGRLIRIRGSNGDSTTIERAAGTGEPLAIVAPYGQRTTLSLDGNKHLAHVTDAASGEAYTLNNTTDGLLLNFADPRGTVEGHSQTFTYNNDDGRLAQDQDAAGATQTLGYTDGGLTQTVTRRTQEQRVTTYQVTQMLDGLRRKLVSYPNHAVSSRTDSMNTATLPYGDVTREVGPAGDATLTYPKRDKRYGMLAEVPETTYTSLPSGLRRMLTASRDTLINGVVTETAGVNGNIFTTSYAPATHTTRTLSPEGRTSTTTRDAVGRPVSVQVGSSLSPIGLAYDTHGRLTGLTQGSRAWRYSYDMSGRLQAAWDTLGHTTTCGYDASDRLTSQVLPGNRTVGYSYDASGNLTSLTPPGSSAHTFSYTPVGLNDSYTPPNVDGITDPTTRYWFNGDRQLTQVIPPDGGLVRVAYGSSTGLLDSLTQTSGRNALTYSPTGQLASVTSPDGVILSYGYDGPILRSEAWAGLRGSGSVDSVSTLLNSAFQPSRQTVNGSSPASFGYDRDGLLDSVTVNGSTETIVHRPSDGLDSTTTIGVVGSTTGHNAYGELTSLGYTWPGGSFQQSLVRDALGRITQLTESWNGGPDSVFFYRYDGAGRLDSIAVNGQRRAGYTYDDNGNRLWTRWGSWGDTTGAKYDAQDRLVRYGGTSYEYSASGALVQRSGPVGGDTLGTRYDALGNLVGVYLKQGNGGATDSITYVTDGANRRVGRNLDGERTDTWLYQDGLRIVAELGGDGSLINRYVYGTRGHVPDLVVYGGQTYRLITDQLGSVRGAVRVSDGYLRQRQDFDAWGNLTHYSMGRFMGLGYAGGPMSDRTWTGLIRFGARDYDPSVGRWTSKDPIGFVGSWNQYQYTEANPVPNCDPAGTQQMFGNWGGPNYRNGENGSEFGEYPYLPSHPGYRGTIGPPDECFREHDLALRACSCIHDPMKRWECRKEADDDLAYCLASMGDRSGVLGVMYSAVMIPAELFFLSDFSWDNNPDRQRRCECERK